VRLAGFTSVLSTLLPAALGILRREHPGLNVSLTDTHPPEALALLRAGLVDAALIFRYDQSAPEPGDIRLLHVVDDPTYLLTRDGSPDLADHRDSTWIAGCDRCRTHLVDLCELAGFEPDIGYVTDDMVLMQALVGAGLGVTTIPGLALRSHRLDGITATELPGATRHIYAATYGQPPDPPATEALLSALAAAA
jgi:DNA-binding transcriptional LysR family regulator